jgi:hypothetical protein
MLAAAVFVALGFLACSQKQPKQQDALTNEQVLAGKWVEDVESDPGTWIFKGDNVTINNYATGFKDQTTYYYATASVIAIGIPESSAFKYYHYSISADGTILILEDKDRFSTLRREGGK